MTPLLDLVGAHLLQPRMAISDRQTADSTVSKVGQGLETSLADASSNNDLPPTDGRKTMRKKTTMLVSGPSYTSSMANAPSSLFDSIVFVVVGANAKEFGLHKGLLCHHSSFFDSALNGSFKEATEKSVTLVEESESTFAMFTAWLYTQKLISHKDVRDSPCSIEELITLYIFGDKLGILELRIQVMDTLIGHIQSRNASQTAFKLVSHIVLIYNNTPDQSPLRKLLVDVMVYDHKIPEFITDNPYSASWTPELLRDLLVASIDVRSKAKTGLQNAPFAWDTQKYYFNGPSPQSYFATKFPDKDPHGFED